MFCNWIEPNLLFVQDCAPIHFLNYIFIWVCILLMQYWLEVSYGHWISSSLKLYLKIGHMCSFWAFEGMQQSENFRKFLCEKGSKFGIHWLEIFFHSYSKLWCSSLCSSLISFYIHEQILQYWSGNIHKWRRTERGRGAPSLETLSVYSSA